MIQVRPFESCDAAGWDMFCQRAYTATFLHTRRFLSYHGDRFEDRSLIIEDDKSKWLGVFPAAWHSAEADCIVSHPGITYGGVLHAGKLKGDRMVEALQAIRAYYQARGYARLRYKVVPHVYHGAPAQDDVYALFRMGAVRYRCDLSCAVDLVNRLPVSGRRKRSLKKARQADVRMTEGTQHVPVLWSVLRENLARKHGAEPVHSEQEIGLLIDRFPESIRVVVAEVDGRVEAGVIIFVSGPVHHAQYIASSEAGNAVNALDAVFEYGIELAREQGARWFDFGISNEDGGRVLNDGLYRFKTEFGGGGVVHEFYELSTDGQWV